MIDLQFLWVFLVLLVFIFGLLHVIVKREALDSFVEVIGVDDGVLAAKMEQAIFYGRLSNCSCVVHFLPRRGRSIAVMTSSGVRLLWESE